MPNETLIAEIENVFAEIVDLGGQNEDSKIVPNLTVVNAAPTNLDGWLIVSDNRDGDNILARKVGSVVYSNNDLVNVIFPKGGEAIAFQQGSESTNSGIWEIVPSTSTDIFYNKGQVGIGNTAPKLQLQVGDDAGDSPVNPGIDGVFVVDTVTGAQVAIRDATNNAETIMSSLLQGFVGTSTNHNLGFLINNLTKATLTTAGAFGIATSSPDAKLEVIDASGAQLRLTHTDGGKFVDFTVNTTHDLTVTPSSTGQIILQPTIDSVDFFQVLDAAGTPILNVDSTNENIGIGWTTTNLKTSIANSGTNSPPVVPGDFLPGSGTTEPEVVLGLVNENASGTYVGMAFQVRTASVPGAFIGLERTADFQGDLFFQIRDAASTSPEIMRLRHNGDVGIGTASPGDRLTIQGDSGSQVSVGVYTGDGDGTDNTTFAVYLVGTPGSITNRERLLLQGLAGDQFRFRSDANGTGTLRPLVFETGTNTSQVHLATDGNVGLSVTSPSTRLDIGAGAIEFNEMTAPAAGAANTARLFTQDNGAGKTQLAVRFNTGAIQILATEP